MSRFIPLLLLLLLIYVLVRPKRQPDEESDDDYFGITRNPVLVGIHWAYTTFKWLIVIGLIVGLGISHQCYAQFEEICQATKICDK